MTSEVHEGFEFIGFGVPVVGMAQAEVVKVIERGAVRDAQP